MEETTRDKGDALEKSVEFIFQSAGFETDRNVKVAKYEVDVRVKVGDRTVIIECKNYQNSNLTIRNLIHQWNSKNELIKASKIIIVISGAKLKKSDEELAHKFNIELWDDEVLNKLFNLCVKPSELRHELLKEVSFEKISIAELYRDEISGFVIRPLLTNSEPDDEEIYRNFNNWLRAFIRTELQLNGVSKENRKKHIELFEGLKETRGGFFKLFKTKRSEVDYWDELGNRLQKQRILPEKMQKRYYSYMCELFAEYESQQEYYESKTDDESRMLSLIKDRIYNAILCSDELCDFGVTESQTVTIIPQNEGEFLLRVPNIDDKQANFINWIVTSEFSLVRRTNDKGFPETDYMWWCSSLVEAAEKAYRILDEFYGFDEGDILEDFSLK